VTNFMMSDPIRNLQAHLLEKIPALERWLEAARAEHEEDPQSEYWLFSYVVRPYLESLLAAGSGAELAQAWDVFERLATSGGASVKNELFVTMEELNLWHFFRFMGPALREHWVGALTWYPTHKNRAELMNTHVNQAEFRARWLEEIEKIGGFNHLTSDEEHRICAALWLEFQVEPWHN
jgi:hypothetical protein